MPYSRPTLTQLVARIADDVDARMPGADSRLRRSVLDVLVRILAAALAGVYGLIDWVWRQIFPDTAEGDQLARWAAIWGVTRKAAVPATGTISLTGVNGSTVPIGTIVSRSDGAQYLTSGAATIVLGVADVGVSAVDAGTGGNAVAGQRLTFVSPVAGVGSEATIAAGGIVGGASEEDDEALRARLLDRIQRPPHGGNRNDYAQWALDQAGVTRAWVYPAELGLGTVTVRFVMDGRVNIIPEPADIAAVQAVLDILRPVTADLSVVAPIAAPLNLTIRALPPSGAVQAAITEELTDLLRREAEPGGTILISHIREAISLAAGELDHEVIAPGGNVNMPTGEMPIIGAIVFVA